MVRRSALIVALVAATPVVLAGCTVPHAAAPTPSTSATPSVGEGLDACLVGSWTADADLPGDFMEHVVLDQLSDVPDAPTAVRADGTVSLGFQRDGSFEYKPDISFEIDFPAGGTQPGDLTGAATGTWRTDDDLLVSKVEQNDVLLRLGPEGDEPANGTYGWENLPIAASKVSCGDDRMTVEFLLGDTAIPMEFSRAE